ncbi:MAG: YceI family protein [Burkholderiales bacterium]
MMRRFLASMLVTLGVAVPATAQEVYVADPAHMYAHFSTGHLGIAWVHGRFNRTPVARVTLDRAAKTGSIEVVIDTASVDTGHEKRDLHIRSADYLDVEKFPTITFKSNSLKFDGDMLVAADGDLTLMGVTRPVSLKVAMFRCIQHPANKRDLCGAEASTQIKRSEWGLKRGATGIGDDVRISIQIEAYKQQ